MNERIYKKKTPDLILRVLSDQNKNFQKLRICAKCKTSEIMTVIHTKQTSKHDIFKQCSTVVLSAILQTELETRSQINEIIE